MGISASNLSGSNIFRNIQTPFANRAEITRGMFRTSSSSALAPSNTAYGTNANAALGGPTYISSAAVLAQNAITSSNIVTTQSSIEQGSSLQQALSTIAAQTPGANASNIFTTSKTQNIQPQQTGVNTKEFSPVNVFSNIRTSSPVIDNGLSLTGRNANIDNQQAANIAAVQAGLNLKFSAQGTQALQALQNNAALAAMQAANITGRMDGMIPIAAATLSDFSSTTTSSTSNNRVFDNVTSTFNQILGEGGQGGGGGLFQPQRDEEASSNPQEKKKGLNLLG